MFHSLILLVICQGACAWKNKDIDPPFFSSVQKIINSFRQDERRLSTMSGGFMDKGNDD